MTQYITLPKRSIDITGQRYGRLVALGPVGLDAQGNIVWRCSCDCGKTTRVASMRMRSGHTKSCGCLSRELRVVIKTHGMCGTRIYEIWKDMVKRCNNPNGKAYANYGGRGIFVCAEWRHDFQAFYDYVSQLPNYDKKGYSLDRIDNEEGYRPENIRWSSRTQQNRNKRNTVMLTYNGKTQSLPAWADELGMSRKVLHDRIFRSWSVERALTQSVRPPR